MNAHWNAIEDRALSRRELLRCSGGGFATLALAGLLAEESRSGEPDLRDPLAPHPPHFPARAKRVIFLFMHGGPSQVDTFDHKPLLERDHGKPLPFPKPRVVSSQTGNLLRSPFRFQRHGESGIAVSELFGNPAGNIHRQANIGRKLTKPIIERLCIEVTHRSDSDWRGHDVQPSWVPVGFPSLRLRPTILP